MIRPEASGQGPTGSKNPVQGSTTAPPYFWEILVSGPGPPALGHSNL
jgi:hypothetical protein